MNAPHNHLARARECHEQAQALKHAGRLHDATVLYEQAFEHYREAGDGQILPAQAWQFMEQVACEITPIVAELEARTPEAQWAQRQLENCVANLRRLYDSTLWPKA